LDNFGGMLDWIGRWNSGAPTGAQSIHMLSWNALDPFPFRPEGEVATAFIDLGKSDLRAAAQYVCELPYGRNSNPKDPLIVLSERKGTCSTKHALLRRLAIEQEFGLALVLGIYEMTETNTPGVGSVLQRHGLGSLVEAHCYLKMGNARIDVTRPPSPQLRVTPIEYFLHEEEIGPEQITYYKISLHKRFLENWLVCHRLRNRYSLEDIWAVREECIARLSEEASANTNRRW
jgi:hypothetical protein